MLKRRQTGRAALRSRDNLAGFAFASPVFLSKSKLVSIWLMGRRGRRPIHRKVETRNSISRRRFT